MGIKTSEHEFYLENFNCLANLQLMEELPNQEKSDTNFNEWLQKSYPDDQDRKVYMNKNFIPDNIDLSLNCFS